MSEPVCRECPTCRGRPWAVWGWTDEGWPIWCPCCGGRGFLPADSVTDTTARGVADVPFIVTDDDEEG